MMNKTTVICILLLVFAILFGVTAVVLRRQGKASLEKARIMQYSGLLPNEKAQLWKRAESIMRRWSIVTGLSCVFVVAAFYVILLGIAG